MTWFNILIALLRSRKARQIVWLHYNVQEKFVALGIFIAALLIVDIALTKHHEIQNNNTSSQVIASTSLSITSNTSGNLAVTMSPASPVFSGTLMLSSSGNNCSNASSDNAYFQISGSVLETKGFIPDGSYTICVTAIEAGIINSPFNTSFTIRNNGEVPHDQETFNPYITNNSEVVEVDVMETASPVPLLCSLWKC